LPSSNFHCRYFPHYFNIIYNLSPSSKKYKKASKLVHDFAMDIITRRRKELEEKVGGCAVTFLKISDSKNIS